MHDVIVIGGGVSGLAAAHNLSEKGHDVRVLERQVRVGGNVVSEKFDGFLMEHGPTTFNASIPEAVEQIRTLGLLERAHDLGPGVKKRYLLHKDRLTGISTHPLGFLLSGYLSIPGRLSMMAEGFRPRRKDTGDETIHAFVTRRFGREFADKIIDPMAAGIFMGDSRALSISGAFSRLVEMEEKSGSITRAILGAKRNSEPGRHLYSWSGGIGTIAQRLARGLGDRIDTGVTVKKIRKAGQGFETVTDKTVLRSRAIVLAVQPHVAAGLLESVDRKAAAAAAGISSPAVNIVFLGYRKSRVGHPLDGLGFLSTKSTSRIISGAQFTSTMYPGRAPDGYISIQAYAGGARNPELGRMPEDQLIARVHRELADTLSITGAPEVVRTRRWPLGLPQYTLGHDRRRTVLETTDMRTPGLFVTGNFLGGVSVANCLATALTTGGKVGEFLEEDSGISGVDKAVGG
jgi:oxygen-dependent protoporphyrinogen oxidase